jgi:malonyl-CoA decarboxylase
MATNSLEPKAPSTLTHLRRKTMLGILRTWREIKGTARGVIGSDEVHPSLPKEDMATLRRQMQECLSSKGGEITARAQTVELGKTYLGLTDTGRAKFLRLLAEDFDLDHAKLIKRIDAFKNAGGKGDVSKLENDLREALVTPRSVILRQFNGLPDGFKFLVDMRSDLMPLVGKSPALKGLEYDLKEILSAWFDIGLLDLVEITWNSPAAILEKLMAYEAVHKIRSWDDMKNRLDTDRRVYAFFHNKMPHEPLIFIYVALTDELSDNVQTILDESSPVMDVKEANTAIFYSISNAQKGLSGISFGNFLIKRVVDKLSGEMKRLKHFSTLSPVPGFRAWLDPHLAKGDESLLLPKEIKEINALAESENAAKGLLQLLEGEWHKDAKRAEKLRAPLMRLCARYLLTEKKKLTALDPVAHFHLTNGARLERINWMGDTSAKGFKQAAGLMVNYYYDPDDIDDNHENYVTEGKIAASRSVRGLI